MDGDLCARCAQLDITSATFQRTPKSQKRRLDAEQNIKLGLFDDLQRKQTSCRLCHFFVEAVLARVPVHRSSRKASWCSLRIDHAEDYHHRWVRVTLRFSDGGASEDIELLPFAPGPESVACSGRQVKRHEVDLPTIRSWISTCRDCHRTCEDNPDWFGELHGPELLRVIDIRRDCLVRIPLGYDFVALSYVWGQTSIPSSTTSTLDNLMVPGGLSSILSASPRTITDAIQLMKDLDEPYLWIDSLCIVQDDSLEKHNQFQKMHIVFGLAKLVLIAATGDDANAGLPGVTNHKRELHQVFAQMAPDLRLIAALPELQDVLPLTVWSGRGWTFQEGLLARRKLIFTRNAVYFSCDVCVSSEDRSFGADKILPNEDDILPAVNHFEDRRWFHGIFPQQAYWNVIQKYTKLRLTYGKDILYALSGVLEALGGEMRSSFLFGLPELYFDSSILWHPAQPLKRRLAGEGEQQMPSWSWTGWYGSVSAVAQVRDVYASEGRGMRKKDGSLVARSYQLQKRLLRVPGSEPDLTDSHLPDDLKRVVAKTVSVDFVPPAIDWFTNDMYGDLRPISHFSQTAGYRLEGNLLQEFTMRCRNAICTFDNARPEMSDTCQPTIPRLQKNLPELTAGGRHKLKHKVVDSEIPTHDMRATETALPMKKFWAKRVAKKIESTLHLSASPEDLEVPTVRRQRTNRPDNKTSQHPIFKKVNDRAHNAVASTEHPNLVCEDTIVVEYKTSLSLEPPRNMPTRQLVANAQPGRYLRFTTLSAMFWLCPSQAGESDLSKNVPNNDGARLLGMSIMRERPEDISSGGDKLVKSPFDDANTPNTSGNLVGYVVIHSADFDVGKAVEAEMIIVSKARRPGESLVPNKGQRRLSMNDYKGAYLHDSMLIVRDEDGVAERVGLGTILESAWLSANPVLKDIVLG
jgi:hypothetical protein